GRASRSGAADRGSAAGNQQRERQAGNGNEEGKTDGGHPGHGNECPENRLPIARPGAPNFAATRRVSWARGAVSWADMGAWGPGPFDNDAAADFLQEAEGSVARAVVRTLRGIVRAPAGRE